MLYAVEHMNEDPALVKKTVAKKKTEEWLSTIPENAALPIPWKDATLIACEYSDAKYADLQKVDIALTEENGVFTLVDIPSQKILLQTPRFHPFNYGRVNQTRVICLYQHLFILQADEAFVPFDNMSEQWKVLDSEITLPYLSEEFIYVRFNLDRLQKELGDYVIQLDHEGKILGKRTINSY
jgi:hypothetical protein